MLKEYLNYKTEKKQINEYLFEFLANNKFTNYYVNTYIDTFKHEVFYIFYGLENKKIIYTAYITRQLVDRVQCYKNFHYYRQITNNYFLEWIDSSAPSLNLVSFIENDNVIQKIYNAKYNYSILPTQKYMMRKLEKDYDALKPLLVIKAMKFLSIYQGFYNNICKLRQIFKDLAIYPFNY